MIRISKSLFTSELKQFHVPFSVTTQTGVNIDPETENFGRKTYQLRVLHEILEHVLIEHSNFQNLSSHQIKPPTLNPIRLKVQFGKWKVQKISKMQNPG